jgi:hypothetical protein
VNRSGFFVGKTSLKRRRAYPQITQIFADYGTERNRTFLISENPCKSVKSVDETFSGPGETDDFLFAAADDALRRHESDFHVFLGARHQIAAATQVALVLNVLAMTLDRFDTQVERMHDLAVAKAEPNKRRCASCDRAIFQCQS